MFEKTVAVAVLAGGLQALAVAPAHAQSGFLCGFTRYDHPADDRDWYLLDAGPMLSAGVLEPGGEVQDDISITCTFQVGAPGGTHAGPDAVSATSPTGKGVAVLTPTPVTYDQPSGEDGYLCTEVSLAGAPRYYDAWNSVWSGTPDVSCEPLLACACPEQPPLDETVLLVVESLVCDPLLQPGLAAACALVSA